MSGQPDNWPKHPDGTNMSLGEMPKEDRKRIWRAAAERYKARCDGSEAHKRLAAIIQAQADRTDQD